MVIVGAGPIGLAAVTNARLFGPAPIVVVDRETSRLDAAKSFGADGLVQPAGATAAVAEASGGLGAAVAIEAVGPPETFELYTRLVRPGGHVANIGVHGPPATLHPEQLWIKNVTITTGLVDTSSTPMLAAGRPEHEPVRHPPVRARRDGAGLRRLRPPTGQQRAEGGASPELTGARRRPRPVVTPHGRRSLHRPGLVPEGPSGTRTNGDRPCTHATS
ncbi:zinc-binding dehydrogenase [Amycolatopsis sp. CA-161197]|uniref:zinc-binding dehydrogenase n=1 Tax=Amycolatopsis sp. CA-161197 TaxID=3239922 RepID=UPI003D91713B